MNQSAPRKKICLNKKLCESFKKNINAIRYVWQNFRLTLLRHVNRLYVVIHKTKMTKAKVLPCVTMGE